MRKLVLALVTVVLLAMSAPGVARAAEGGADRPWKGGSFGGTVNLVTGETTGGEVISTHLGRGTFEIQFTSPSTAVATLTAPDGDQIHEALTDVVIGPDLTSSYDIAVTGGTGRFAGATGHADGFAALTPTSTADVYVITATFDGSISY